MLLETKFRFTKSKSHNIKNDYEWDAVLSAEKQEPGQIHYVKNFSDIRKLRKLYSASNTG